MDEGVRLPEQNIFRIRRIPGASAVAPRRAPFAVRIIIFFERLYQKMRQFGIGDVHQISDMRRRIVILISFGVGKENRIFPVGISRQEKMRVRGMADVIETCGHRHAPRKIEPVFILHAFPRHSFPEVQIVGIVVTVAEMRFIGVRERLHRQVRELRGDNSDAWIIIADSQDAFDEIVRTVQRAVDPVTAPVHGVVSARNQRPVVSGDHDAPVEAFYKKRFFGKFQRFQPEPVRQRTFSHGNDIRRFFRRFRTRIHDFRFLPGRPFQCIRQRLDRQRDRPPVPGRVFFRLSVPDNHKIQLAVFNQRNTGMFRRFLELHRVQCRVRIRLRRGGSRQCGESAG